ncbi:hypothetical protein A0H81_01623 [Grifola frondosa]|uniref:Uncharacterized protein n=1 Tax=Grifola frondosa TaxID=5627 RepID=A0A1C7MQI3_GRIFR|nr:hypothetical protein A0H81_01623 [Grifola frondosa]
MRVSALLISFLRQNFVLAINISSILIYLHSARNCVHLGPRLSMPAQQGHTFGIDERGRLRQFQRPAGKKISTRLPQTKLPVDLASVPVNVSDMIESNYNSL